MAMPTSHQEFALLNHKGAVDLACGNDKVAHRIFKGIVETLGILSAAPQAAAGPQGDPLASLILPIGLVVLFYFFLIRPQSQRHKEHKAMGQCKWGLTNQDIK